MVSGFEKRTNQVALERCRIGVWPGDREVYDAIKVGLFHAHCGKRCWRADILREIKQPTGGAG